MVNNIGLINIALHLISFRLLDTITLCVIIFENKLTDFNENICIENICIEKRNDLINRLVT